MKVLITGATGQIGKALHSSSPENLEVRALNRSSLDIADAAAVQAVVSDWRPGLIINAAAYTAVDKAESEQQLAYAINAHGPEHLARAAARLPDCRMIQISTDYVFDGTSSRPYRPSDVTRPINVYGQSKLRGEQAVCEHMRGRALVLRTAWVYAPQGNNFLRTMLRIMQHGTARVVADQRGTPTTAASIAAVIWSLAGLDLRGTFHWTDGGAATWYDFAMAIAEEGHIAGLLPPRVQVTPIATADFPTAARRPASSVLDITETCARLGVTPIPWRQRLHETIAHIKREAA